MITSILTSKGQTTIPQIVRKALGLANHDRLIYEVTHESVVLKPLKGNLFHLRGSIRPKQTPEDFLSIRESVQKTVARSRSRK